MANVASPVNTNSRDLDPVVNPSGYVGLKRARGRVTATSTTPDTMAQEVVIAATTGTKSSVAGSASSVTLLAANADRAGAIITNDSSAVLYVDLSGGTASTTSYSITLGGSSAAPFEAYEVPFGLTGLITGIWASATGNARVTEFEV